MKKNFFPFISFALLSASCTDDAKQKAIDKKNEKLAKHYLDSINTHEAEDAFYKIDSTKQYHHIKDTFPESKN